MKWNVQVVSRELGRYVRDGVEESAVPRELIHVLESLEHILGARLPFTIVISCVPDDRREGAAS
jgi:hypothetical protein